MITLRPATPADGPLLWAWRNDPAARAASLSTAEIPLEDHLAWYRAALEDPNRQILIAESDGLAAGMVRFDQDAAAQEITTSIALAPAMRGKGLSATILGDAIAACRFTPARFRAVIRASNTASLALFRRVGFVSAGKSDPVQLHLHRSETR